MSKSMGMADYLKAKLRVGVNFRERHSPTRRVLKPNNFVNIYTTVFGRRRILNVYGMWERGAEL